MLEAEIGVRAKRKVGFLPGQTPDNLPGCTVDFVYRAGVAGGN